MKRALFATLLGISLLVIPTSAFAQNLSGGNTAPNLSGGNTQMPGGGGQYSVVNPLAANSFCGLIKNLLQAALAIGIPIAVLFIVYAGFKFVLAQGNATKLSKARTNFMWTLVGIGIFVGAWLLASVVANTVNALGAGGGQPNIISCN
jgi:hypothetical protein